MRLIDLRESDIDVVGQNFAGEQDVVPVRVPSDKENITVFPSGTKLHLNLLNTCAWEVCLQEFQAADVLLRTECCLDPGPRSFSLGRPTAFRVAKSIEGFLTVVFYIQLAGGLTGYLRRIKLSRAVRELQRLMGVPFAPGDLPVQAELRDILVHGSLCGGVDQLRL